MHQAGHEVSLFERHARARPAGNILNLWPPPLKALGLMGVDLEDFGAPCRSEFRSATGHVRATVNLPQTVIDEYGGGFIGLLRPELYERLLQALPDGVLQTNRSVERITQDREAWTSIRRRGRAGYQWWVLTAHDSSEDFTADLHSSATKLSAEFPAPLPQLIAAAPHENVQRWVLRDRKPLRQWPQGRVAIVGDAAHPTSPYAAYGAGMSIEDGYSLGRSLAGVDLKDPDKFSSALAGFEAPQRPHTGRHSQIAWAMGKVFHHAPRPIQPVRDAIFDHTPCSRN